MDSTTSGSGTTSSGSSQPTATSTSDASASSSQLVHEQLLGMPAEFVRDAQRQARQNSRQAKPKKKKKNRRNRKRNRENNAAKQRQSLAQLGLDTSDVEADEPTPGPRPGGTPQKRPNEARKRRALNRVRFQLTTAASTSPAAARDLGLDEFEGDPLDTFEPQLRQEFKSQIHHVADDAAAGPMRPQQHQRRRHPAEFECSALLDSAGASGDESYSGRLVIATHPTRAIARTAEPGECADND